jgi:hypothetical protein
VAETCHTSVKTDILKVALKTVIIECKEKLYILAHTVSSERAVGRLKKINFKCMMFRNCVISCVVYSYWQKSKHLVVEASVLEDPLCGRVLEK